MRYSELFWEKLVFQVAKLFFRNTLTRFIDRRSYFHCFSTFWERNLWQRFLFP